ncbi:alpha/beta fold hydrolase [Sphingomonas abietis]|uniref:Alpha/beta hydrolase n=1 Tax=Sphingomonas abietis TaxID=3012344 RepID=A0ABY7NKJ8_9SPHN|nr:alpha/beta hydrolase [Sphingomonas abietis]WBO22060.1 alpha/beta hydrolase [Sphingomonas abietis]
MVSQRYEDGWWQSTDGLKLHYRDYPGGADAKADGRPPILCIPGLTRNARDFEALAERLSPEWRVICVDLRGRGESPQSPDSASYTPPTYVLDIGALYVALGIDKAVLLGTSLGGLIAMLMALTTPERLAGVLLNDIGPVIDPAGISRIRSYVGKSASWPTWLHAARALAETERDVFPRYMLEDWLLLAKRRCRLTSAGRIVFDYDMRIAEPIRQVTEDAPAPDLWPAFSALRGRPLALVRGGRSDLLSAKLADEMVSRLPGLDLTTVPDVGHAPTLDEPEAVAAIDRLLDRVRSAR